MESLDLQSGDINVADHLILQADKDYREIPLEAFFQAILKVREEIGKTRTLRICSWGEDPVTQFCNQENIPFESVPEVRGHDNYIVVASQQNKCAVYEPQNTNSK